ELPFYRRRSDGTYERNLRSWNMLGQVALAAATAAAGAYYAFFTCALAVFAGVYAWVVLRRWQTLASAGGIAGLIVLFGLVQHLPTFVYQSEYGWNPVTERLPEEADLYGLKIAQLLLPIEDHRLTVLRRI